jgi:type IV pilus assembly protein PilV
MAISIKNQSGVGLIEVLVAVLILGTALLTLTSLQTRSLQFNQSAYLRSQANILAYDIIDRIRINRGQADNYDLDFTSTVPTGTSLRDTDLREWRTNVAKLLPGGTGKVSCDNNKKCTIQIQWVEQATKLSSENQVMTFSYTSQV